MGNQELFSAIETTDFEKVKMLLATDPTLANRSDEENEPNKPLHVAIGGVKSSPRALMIVVELILAGADVNAKGENGRSPLHEAVELDLVDTAVALVNAGARLDARDIFGHTPFESIAQSMKYACIGFLLARGAGRDIHEAVAFNRIDWVRWILRDNPNVIREGRRSAELLLYAIWNRNIEMLRILIAGGCSINSQPGGLTPLSQAIDSPEMVHLLLDAGADPNGCRPPAPLPDWRYPGWESPLAKAKRRGFAETEALLKQHGATE